LGFKHWAEILIKHEFICFCLLLAAISPHYTRQLPHVMQQSKIFYDPAAVCQRPCAGGRCSAPAAGQHAG
jgi:hypothetical protein